MKIKTNEEADVNITSLIDCLMQCIIFFMVIMSAQYVFCVAIKEGANVQKEEKSIIVFVQSDYIDKGHLLVRDGIIKINGEEVPLTVTDDRKKWDGERKKAFDYLEYRIKELLGQGFKKEAIMIQGEMLTYHEKIMMVVDRGKANNVEGFNLGILEEGM